MSLPPIPSSLPFIAPRMRIIKDAALQRAIIGHMVPTLIAEEFDEIGLPTIERRSTYEDKIGPEMVSEMFYLEDDDSNDTLCLRPEGTATLQLLAQGPWKTRRDVRVFYVSRCFRYERPQKGRYREFTQLGVEILNPRDPKLALEYVAKLAHDLITDLFVEFECDETIYVNDAAERGLTYYTDRKGFEINVPSLGPISQVCGGGAYAEGAGFAFGIDRLALAIKGETE